MEAYSLIEATLSVGSRRCRPTRSATHDNGAQKQAGNHAGPTGAMGQIIPLEAHSLARSGAVGSFSKGLASQCLCNPSTHDRAHRSIGDKHSSEPRHVGTPTVSSDSRLVDLCWIRSGGCVAAPVWKASAGLMERCTLSSASAHFPPMHDMAFRKRKAEV